MTIKLITKDGYEGQEVKFSRLVEGEYLIVSKNFDEPHEGLSNYCKKTGGNWYRFTLTLHEYTALDLKAMTKSIVTDAGEVTYFDSDNEYDVHEKKPELGEKWVKSQGTVLKALNKAEVGERLKITMVENAKKMMVYSVESLDDVATPVSIPEPVVVSDNTSASTPVVEPVIDQAVLAMVKNLKASSVPVDQVIAVVMAGNPELNPELITKVYMNGDVQ